MKKTVQKSSTMSPVAIVGIGCLFPKATGLKAYWRLLFQGIDAITEVPASHWSREDYFDTDPTAEDKIYCTRGGFLSPIDFDPTEYGIPPNILEATDTSQILGLVAAKAALEDAGYGEGGKSFNRDRTSVILGVTGTQELVIPLGARLDHPKWRKALKIAGVSDQKTETVVKQLSAQYVSWQENSFPGLLGNVVAGRISNRLDLGGTNCVVDAACASSMSAIHLATLELTTGRCDMVLTGGVDTLNDIFMHMCFGRTGILSPTGDVRPFSENADGTLLGEGVGIIALKRLDDAEKNGDRIYAVIRSVGTASDGRSQSIYAPRKEGQVKALTTAYEMAGITPDTVDFIEAHGTGTRVGDQTEFKTLTEVFSPYCQQRKANENRCALGAVKSMIGHTKAAAGTAGLIKAALALHHKTMPPTLKVDKPDPDLQIGDSPFCLNTVSRPWFSHFDHPRRSGVSAFGFGGSNFHVVLEEYQPEKPTIAWDGSVEIIALSAPSPDDLVQKLLIWKKEALEALSTERFATHTAESRQQFDVSQPCRLLSVIDQLEDVEAQLIKMVDVVTTALQTENESPQSWVSGNIFYGSGPVEGKLAFVFPGQGSQYVNMGRDLACVFPDTLDAIEQFNHAFKQTQRLSDFIYPPPDMTKKGKIRQEDLLRSTDVAQPAIGAVSLGMFRILKSFGLSPESVCGHSYGELPALLASEWLNTNGLVETSIARGRFMAEAGHNAEGDPGTMLAVKADLDKLDDLVQSLESDVILANRNSPSQGVLSGSQKGIDAATKKCREAKFRAIALPVAAAFHSHLVAGAQKPFRKLLDGIDWTPSNIPVYSNTTGEAYPTDVNAARDLLGNQLINPVDFVANINNQYESGARTFVEVGPKTVLTGLVRQILRKREHIVIAMDASNGKKSGITDLAKCLCHLSAIGYKVKLDTWESPPPEGSPKKPMMKIPVGGANITNPPVKDGRLINGRSSDQKKNISTYAKQPEIVVDKPMVKKDPMINQSIKQPDRTKNSDKAPSPSGPENTVYGTLDVIQEGLRSMREIQAQTTRAHELYLKTQAEAARVLESLMLNSKKTAQTTPKELNTSPLAPISENEPATTSFDPATETVQPIQAIEPNLATTTRVSPHKERGKDFDNATSDSSAASIAQAEATSEAIETGNHEVAGTLFEVISELTGYPVAMLKPDMALEADLGIDSIKRVEILSTMEERMPQLSTISPEDMGDIKTLAQIIAHLDDDIPPGNDSLASEENKLSTTPPPIETSNNNLAPDHVEQVLFSVISELTGYPVTMLKSEMALEADLGIDSIKRVEILSTLEDRMPQLSTISPEDMGDIKTLAQIVHHLTRNNAGDSLKANRPCGAAESQLTTVPVTSTPASVNIRRQIVAAEVVKTDALPLCDKDLEGTIVITEDDKGLARALATAIDNKGGQAVVVTPALIAKDGAFLESITPPVVGFIPVLPADQPLDHEGVKHLFLLTQSLGRFWNRSGFSKHPFMIGVIRMDGAFGFLNSVLPDPMHGALTGLVKTAAMEWPRVRCRAIDADAAWNDPPAIAKAILNAGGGDFSSPVEIGLHPALKSDEQYRLDLKDANHPNRLPALSVEDVVVVSGGARGITAESIVALGRDTGARFALLGRSPVPEPLPDWLNDLTEPREIKKAIMTHAFQGQAPSPVKLEEAYCHFNANREIQQTLNAFSRMGVMATYYSVDVNQADQVEKILDQIRSELGPITGLIHGAGVLRDSLIIDKKPEAFEAVFHTKVKGLEHLLQATRSDKLGHLTLFSSVTARFGNSGQSDYAMANEVLNKMARVEAKKRPDCAVTAINWGPWDCGMVSPTLKRHFEERGVGLIPTQTGAEYLAGEMGAAIDGPVEVIIGCRIGPPVNQQDNQQENQEDYQQGNQQIKRYDRQTDPSEDQSVSSKGPHIRQEKDLLNLSFRREVDLTHYPVLKSHILDGNPVVPFALMTEWFGHGALHENPGLILHGIDDMRLLKGITMKGETKIIRLMAGKARHLQDRYEVTVELRDGVKDKAEVIHSRGRAILVESLKPAPRFEPPQEIMTSSYARSVEEVYETILFHGDHLHGLKRIVGLNNVGMVAEITTAPEPAQWMTEPLRSDWLADPLALDTAYQMASLWCYEVKGMVSLPSYTASYRQFVRRFPSNNLKVILQVKEVTSNKMRGDFTFIDANHTVVAQLYGHETVMDASLIGSFKPHLNPNRNASKGRNAA